jgi:hypothetical protein
MNEAIWKSTLLLSSLNPVLALKYLWNKVWQYRIMECNSYVTMLLIFKKKKILWGIWQMWNTHTAFPSKVWFIVIHGRSICTLQWGQYNKPQWLMEQPVLAILLYNIIFCVINTLKSQDKLLILSAYFLLMNHLQLHSVFKRNNFVAQEKKTTSILTGI